MILFCFLKEAPIHPLSSSHLTRHAVSALHFESARVTAITAITVSTNSSCDILIEMTCAYMMNEDDVREKKFDKREGS